MQARAGQVGGGLVDVRPAQEDVARPKLLCQIGLPLELGQGRYLGVGSQQPQRLEQQEADGSAAQDEDPLARRG